MRDRRSITNVPPCVSHQALDFLLHSEVERLFPAPTQLPRRRHSIAVLPRQPTLAQSKLRRARAFSYEVSGSGSSLGDDEPPSPATPTAAAGSATADATAAGGWLKIASLAGVLILSGLATNIAFELLSKHEPGSSGILTLFQYVVALGTGGPRHAISHLTAPAIPRRVHMLFCVLMLSTAWCGNRSVEFNLPFPLYLIIKSSTLVASMAVGAAAAGKRYSRGQCLGCVGMTIGVVLSTLVARSPGASPPSSASAPSADGSVFGSVDGSLLTGASLCMLSTLCMALLGVVQEQAFGEFGQHHEEAIFYIHAIGLAPLLVLQAESPLARLQRWMHADGAARLWALVVLNLGACQLCKVCFFALLGATSSLSASLCVLSYRFLGVLVSALFVNAPPPPPPLLFLGVALVTAGGLVYLRSSQPSAPAASARTPAAAPAR